jgi:hypothetical protein
VEEELFKGDKRKTWPVQGLITMGSPFGLDLDFSGLKFFPQVEIPALNAS